MESPKFGGITNLSQRGQANAFSIAKYVVLPLCLQANISLAASDSFASPSFAPINPEFTAWQSKVATFNFESRDAEGHTLGLIARGLSAKAEHALTISNVASVHRPAVTPFAATDMTTGESLVAKLSLRHKGDIK